MNYRNCAFVNFTNIANAIKAIEGIKNRPEYASLRVAHGKDRCANPPRTTGGTGNGNSFSGGGPSPTRKMNAPTINISGFSPTSGSGDDGEGVNEAEVAALAAVVEEELAAEGAALG